MEFEFLKLRWSKNKIFPRDTHSFLTFFSLLKEQPRPRSSTYPQNFKRRSLFWLLIWARKDAQNKSLFFFSFNTLHTKISSSFPSEVSHFIKVISFLNIFVSSLKIRNFRYFPSKVPYFFKSRARFTLKPSPIIF